jgi:hypothetical protein
LKIVHEGLQVTVHVGNGQTGEVCNVPQGGILELGLPRDHPEIPCRAIFARISVNGREVLKSPLAIVADGVDIDSLAIKIAIRRLDRMLPQPQVLLTGYTGGAHCCTSTVAATSQSNGTWRFLSLDHIDGDRGFDYLDLDHDSTSVMIDIDPNFLYAFASYAGSFAPTRIRRLAGEKFENVTGDPQYRDFLVERLHDMEQTAAKSAPEPNGYLAAWVAQKALIGELKDGWRTMLVSYDRKSTDGLDDCAVDERLYVKSQYGTSECPPGQQIRVTFPKALASLLLRTGYIRPEQAASIGYDAAKAEEERKATSARYEEALTDGWFVISNVGVCMLSRAPASPAEMITTDRLQGFEDNVSVVQTDNTGTPAVARVERPIGNGMVSAATFYRGMARCETTRRKQEDETDKLR